LKLSGICYLSFPLVLVPFDVAAALGRQKDGGINLPLRQTEPAPAILLADGMIGLGVLSENFVRNFWHTWNVVDNKGPKMRRMRIMGHTWNVYENK